MYANADQHLGTSWKTCHMFSRSPLSWVRSYQSLTWYAHYVGRKSCRLDAVCHSGVWVWYLQHTCLVEVLIQVTCKRVVRARVSSFWGTSCIDLKVSGVGKKQKRHRSMNKQCFSCDMRHQLILFLVEAVRQLQGLLWRSETPIISCHHSRGHDLHRLAVSMWKMSPCMVERLCQLTGVAAYVTAWCGIDKSLVKLFNCLSFYMRIVRSSQF